MNDSKEKPNMCASSLGLQPMLSGSKGSISEQSVDHCSQDFFNLGRLTGKLKR